MRRGILRFIGLAGLLALPAFAGGQEQYGFDSTPPKISVSAKKVQQPKAGRVATIRGSCNEPCRIAATGDVVISRPGAAERTELRLKREFARLSAKQRWRPAMRLGGSKARRTLKGALAKGARAHADIRLRAEDETGNPAKAYIRIKLKD